MRIHENDRSSRPTGNIGPGWAQLALYLTRFAGGTAHHKGPALVFDRRLVFKGTATASAGA